MISIFILSFFFLGSALRLPELQASNSKTFSDAFTALNNSLDGSCYYLKVGEFNKNAMGDYEVAFPNIVPESTWPAYSVVPKHAVDLQKALAFATIFHLKVNLKVNGHSTWGSSANALPESGKTTMLIFMRDFNDIDVHEGGWMDTCGTPTPATVTTGGGVYFGLFYKKMKSYNYSFTGGTCDSVGINGGWVLAGGMSQLQQRALGLGVDNVLQFQVMLSTGNILIVDRCTNAPLFKALRGGGGGLVIVLAATHKLSPGTQAQLYNFAFSNKAHVNYTRWFETLVKHTPTMDDRFTLEPSAFHRNNWGYPSPVVAWTTPGQAFMRLYFLGTAGEAESHSVFKDFKALLDEVPKSLQNYTHLSYQTLADIKAERAWQTYGDQEKQGVFGGHMEGPLGGWAIPMKYFVEHPVDATHLLEEIMDDVQHCKTAFAYSYGGQIHRNKWMSADQVLQGNLREWGWQFNICSTSMLLKLSEKFPVSAGGSWSPNHYVLREAEFVGVEYIDGQWGKLNYIYLLGIKQAYDPSNLFGCRLCVAWPPLLKDYVGFITNPMYFESLKHMNAPDPLLDAFAGYQDAHVYKSH